MKADNIFNLKRFNALVRRECVMNWRFSVIGLMAVVAILVIILVMHEARYINATQYTEGMSSEDYHRLYVSNLMGKLNYYIEGFFLIGALYASMAFSGLSGRSKSVPTLMLPASTTEKYLVKWLATVPLFIAVYFLLCIVADWIRLIFVSEVYGYSNGTMPFESMLFGNTRINDIPARYGWMVLMGFLAVQSFFLLGAVYWRKHHFIKTLASVGVIAAIYIGFGTFIMDTFSDPGKIYTDPEFMRSQKAGEVVFYWLTGLIAVFNYLLAWLRLRETDVA